MTHARTHLAALLAAVAEGIAIGPLSSRLPASLPALFAQAPIGPIAVPGAGADLLTMLVQVVPQLGFALFVYYIFTKSQDKSAAEIRTITDKFEGSLDRVTERFEKQQLLLVDEMKHSAQLDRDQHAKLFTDFLSLNKETLLEIGVIRREFAAIKVEHAALREGRPRSSLPPADGGGERAG